jgi:hypothetical protein
VRHEFLAEARHFAGTQDAKYLSSRVDELEAIVVPRPERSRGAGLQRLTVRDRGNETVCCHAHSGKLRVRCSCVTHRDLIPPLGSNAERDRIRGRDTLMLPGWQTMKNIETDDVSRAS